MSVYLVIYLLIGFAFFYLVLAERGCDNIIEGLASMVILVFLWPISLLFGLVAQTDDD